MSLTGIVSKVFRPRQRELERYTNEGETLQREGGREGVRITIDNKKQSERIAAAHRFLAKNQFMRIGDYAAITGLSRSSAQRELHELEKYKFSGITSRGSGSHRIWVRGER